MTGPRVTNWPPWLFVLMCIGFAVYPVGYLLAPYQPFSVEVREVSPSGEVTFIRQSHSSDDGYASVAAAAWLRGGLLVKTIVYSKGACFAFTVTGRVFVFEMPEADNSPPYKATFLWRGDPHKFAFPNRWYGDV